MHDIAVIAGNPQLVTLGMANDVFFSQPILFTEVGAQFGRLLIYGVEVCRVRQAVLTDFKGNVRVVAGATAVPAAHIPRQGLVSRDGTVSQLTDKTVNADLPSVRRVLVPVVVVLVFAEQSVVGADVAFEVGVIRPSGMHHDALWRDGAARLVAGVVRENKFMQVHLFVLLFTAVV
ncbi:hypothetical protein SDC9_163129 [bioreactor metagenome]|uniref:Uncharacterized protein n=1 Tax=bioreactor metagenome TaxID=1076179 RepID=A0A645FUT5_9ZZZZ